MATACFKNLVRIKWQEDNINKSLTRSYSVKNLSVVGNISHGLSGLQYRVTCCTSQV